jgi:putative ABC transport system permease protein
MEDFDSVAAFVDIKDAQKIMNSSAIDVLKISLTDVKYIDEFQNNVQTKLTEHGLQAKSWMEIASIFGKVKAFYNVQTGIMFSILVFIVLLGISNTVSMSLSERIGEIGTLRALGQSQWSLIRQFMLESIYLCVFAILIGIVLALVLVSIVNSSDIRTEIPGASLPVKVEVGFYWDVIAWVSLLLFVIVNIFTFVLVYRFVRIKIVEALRHNI